MVCYTGALLAVPVIYKDSHTDITGTWNGNGTLSEVTSSNPYEGAHHYQFAYNFTGYWAGFGLNMNNWGNTAPLNFNGYSHLRLAYRGLSSTQVLKIQLRSLNDVFGNNVEVGGASGSYTVVEIPINALTQGTNVDLAAIMEIDMSVSDNMANGSGVVYIDAIELVNSTSNSGLPASATTWARFNGMGKGINTSNWLEAYWLLPFNAYPEVNKYTRAKIQALRSAGFDVFRLPVIFERLGATTPPYTLDFNHVAFSLVDSMILWANLYDFKLIIDNHHGYDLTNANYQSELPRLQAVWAQLTDRYDDLDPERYFFEIFNEPTNQISNANFRTVANALLATIRANETQTHSVWVGASSWNSGYNLTAFTPLNDADVIYTFHNYDPYFFTHQGMSWTSPPYFPALTFPQPGEVATIQSLFSGIKSWSNTYNVPVTLGEYGVATSADATSRCNWIQTLTAAAQAQQFPYLYWDAISPSDAFGFYTDGIIDQAHVIPCFSSALGLYPVLAVTLETFSLDCREEKTRLLWSAFSSNPGHRFSAERSTDGIQWEIFEELDAREGWHAYALEDSGKARYYRLRLWDTDGSSSVSPVKASPCSSAEHFLRIYPNPATRQTTLHWSDPKDAILRIQAYDVLGRLQGDYHFSPEPLQGLSVQGWPAGMYRLSVLTHNGKRSTTTLMVEK
jgi:endoglucanase